MTTKATAIMKWIEEHQRGKVGIYPHRVIMRVCTEFSASRSVATRCVLKHIRKEMTP